MNALEKDLRKVMRDLERFPLGSVSFVEPARGSDVGLPDTFVVVDGHHTALELKRGNSVVRELRPTQRLWHKTAILIGAKTYGATLRSSGAVSIVRILLPGGHIGSELTEEPIVSLPIERYCYDIVLRALR
jgi:hypothetical protein